MPPCFFTVYSEDITREAMEGFEGGAKFGGNRITNLRYADDTTLIRSSKEGLMGLLNRVKTLNEKKDLPKTKRPNIIVVQTLDRDRTANDDVFLDG